jgi:predicted dehydrogenase
MTTQNSHLKNASDHRRDFLKKTVAVGTAASMPYFFSQPKTLASETTAKNDRIPIGLIGAGGMGNGNMRAAKEWVDVVAISDADQSRMESSNKNLSEGKAELYKDYQDILARDDIKVVHIATPDHWHTKPLIEAMLAGKDVYCEKPLTLTIDEGKLIRKVQKETGRIVQVGTQQRSTFNLFTKAIAMVADGRVGKIKRIECAIGGAPRCDSIPVAEVPGALDWDRWLGPAPEVEYRNRPNEDPKKRGNTNCHYEFRWWYEYSGGKLTDWGAHHVDIANWALKANGITDGPVSIGGSAEHPVEFKDGFPVQTDQYNTATKFKFAVKYPGDIEVIITNEGRNGVLIEGDKGRIFVSRRTLDGAPVKALAENPLPEDAIQKVYKGLPMEQGERKAHWANFLHCHREQLEPISDVHSHMEMLNVCHLAGISARLGRDLKWDNDKEEIVGDDQANGFLKRPYRKGYEIEMRELAKSSG